VSTDTTSDLESTLRTRLLTFVPLNGAGPVSEILGTTGTGSGSGGKLFWGRAPDNIDGRLAGSTDPIRWGVLRLKNRRAGMENSEREQMELEVMLYGRPWNQRATLEAIADTMDAAMLRYRDADSGILWIEARGRQSLPPFKEPADSDIVQIMLEYTLVVWRADLIEYHDS
jgi:hypothetical protein